MKYYRVKPQYDNKTRYIWKNRRQAAPNSILIANELYTPFEFFRLANSPACFEVAEISKRAVYTFFGARFESKKEV